MSTVKELVEYLQTLPQEDEVLWQVITKDYIENITDVSLSDEQWSDFVKVENDGFMEAANLSARDCFGEWLEEQ